MILAALLVLHPFAGAASASRVTAPADAPDACGAVCCCGTTRSCGCAAESPDEEPAPTPEPVSLGSRAEIAPASERETPVYAYETASPSVRRPSNGGFTPSTGALETSRLLCVWRT